MATTRESKLVEIPTYLCELMARHRLHPRQALHEIIEDAFFAWEDGGGWTGLPGPWSPGRRPD